MRSFNQLFFIFTLSLTTGILWAYHEFSNYFNSGWEEKRQTENLKENLAESQFQVSLLQHQMKDLEQSVALAIPKEKLASAEKYQETYRDLMSTLRAPASVPEFDMSGVILGRGKKLFAEGQYGSATKEFEKIKNLYPSSAAQVQARFFLAESFYLQREFKKSVDVIDEMVLQFPDHELTGFILLRLGQISEHNNQTEEAQEIYRTVASHFPQPALQQQAKTLLKSMEIE